MNKKINFEKIVFYMVGLIILILPAYLIRFILFGVPSTMLETYIYLTFVAFCIHVLISKVKLNLNKLKLPILILVIAGISSFLANDKMAALGQTKAYFFDGLLVLVMFNYFLKKTNFAQVPLHGYLLSSLTVALWGILQRLGIFGLLSHQKADPMLADQVSQGRILGPFESPNYLAMYILPAVVMLALVLLGNNKPIKLAINKIFAYISIFILLVSLIMSQSIAAILALVLVVSIYLYINFPKARAYILTILVLLSILFSTVIFSKKVSKSDSFFSRLEIYKAAVQISSDHLLVGIGLGNFNDSFGGYIINVPDRMNWEALHPHNLFLNYLVSLGIPGLALFLLLVAKTIRKDSWENKALYFFPFLAIILNGFIDTTFFKNDLAIIFWLFYAFLI